MNPSHTAHEINEIVLRSRAKNAVEMKKNRVPLCRSCHRIYHWGGVTEEKMEIMYQKAEALLKSFGEDLSKW